MPPRRPCLEPGCTNTTTHSRCPLHHRARRNQQYGGDWRNHSKQAIADHLATHGPTCPGYGVPSHPCEPAEFVTDHDEGPMCLACNSRKAATFDKQRAR